VALYFGRIRTRLGVVSS